MKKPKAPRLVTVAIFTTITIIFWVFFSVYSILTSSPPQEVDPKLLEPINPSLNTDSLNKLEEKLFFEEGAVSEPLSISQAPTPFQEIVENPSPTTTPTATAGGRLEGTIPGE